jgi:hypothetical protein
MDQANSGRVWIDNVNRAAIGDVNAEREFALIGDEAVVTAEFLVTILGTIDKSYPVAVDLFGRDERPIAHSQRMAHFAMDRVEPRQHFGFVIRHIDPRNPSDECAPTNAGGVEHRKMFNQLFRDHFGKIDAGLPNPNVERAKLFRARLP